MYRVKAGQMSVKCKNKVFRILLVLRMQRMNILFILAALFVFAACNNNPAKPDIQANDEKKNNLVEQQLNDTTTVDSVREQLIAGLVQNKDYSKALTQIDFLLEKDSSNPGRLYMKGDALEKMGDTAGAILHYNKAVLKAGVFIEAEMRAANLFAETGNKNTLMLCDNLLKNAAAVRFRSDVLMMKGIYFTKTGNTAKALEQFNQILKEDYSYMDAYIEKGLVYYDQKKYAEAWKVFSKSTEVSNTFADGYFWMAKAEEKMNQKEEAIANYKRSLALDQSLKEAREELKRLGAVK
jgi:tetratricopeptide (TPR) repeat protein